MIAGDTAVKNDKGKRVSFPCISYTHVGLLNLNVGRACLPELLPLIGVLKIPPYTAELGWDVKVTVLLGSNLRKKV